MTGRRDAYRQEKGRAVLSYSSYRSYVGDVNKLREKFSMFVVSCQTYSTTLSLGRHILDTHTHNRMPKERID